MSLALIVPAAGSGHRLGADRPKALVEVASVALVRHTLERFIRAAAPLEAVVAAPASSLGDFREALLGLDTGGAAIRVVAGGQTRQESVWAGLEALDCQPEIVCIHDAARPLTPKATVLEVIEAARRSGAATVASRPVDSIRQDGEQDGGSRALDRRRLWMVETPQAFAFDLLHKAHQRARATGLKASDDAALVEACSEVVEVIESQGPNFKVTWPHDLDLLALLLGREH